MAQQMVLIKDLFLSHSHADKSFVRSLARDCEQHGISVWLDEAELLIGDSLIQKIEQAIDRTRYFATVVSTSSIDSAWVKKELEQAIEIEISSRLVKVLPIILGNVDHPPGFLRSKLYADFSGWPTNREQYEGSLKLLIRSVSQRKLQEATTQLRENVPEDLPNDEKPPSRQSIETARSIAATITGLEEYNGISSDAETYYRLGNLNFIQEEFQIALEFYDRAINLIPGHLKARYNKARTLEKLGRYDEAQRAYRTGDQNHPDPRALSSTLINFACICEASGQYQEALDALEKAIAAYPIGPYSYYLASRVCESLGMQKKALVYLDQFFSTVHYESGYERLIEDANARKKALMRQTNGV